MNLRPGARLSSRGGLDSTKGITPPFFEAEAGMRDSEWFGGVAIIAAVVVVLVGGFAIASETSGGSSAPSSVAVSYLNLTIQINQTTGWPQYSPANFSVPSGEVHVKIVDQDIPASWPGCACNVTGTQGNVESINGSAPVSQVSWTAVAHTFTVARLGINVLSPAQSTVTFTIWLNQTGSYAWQCVDPCGADGFTGAPMGVPGFMAGTMTVF